MRVIASLKSAVLNLFRGEPNIEKLKARGLVVGNNFKMLGGALLTILTVAL